MANGRMAHLPRTLAAALGLSQSGPSLPQTNVVAAMPGGQTANPAANVGPADSGGLQPKPEAPDAVMANSYLRTDYM